MASLYSTIKQRYGLKNNRRIFRKASNIYNRFDKDKYKGTSKQNKFLLSRQTQWDTRGGKRSGASYSRKRFKPKNPAQRYAKAVLPKKIYKPRAFSEVVPWETIVNEPAVQRFAYSRVDPEVERERYIAQRQLGSQMAQQGMHRFGTANVARQRLMDEYSRRREEMAQPFMQAGLGKLSDYYGELMNEYYRDPQAFEYKPLDIASYLGGGDSYMTPDASGGRPRPPWLPGGATMPSGDMGIGGRRPTRPLPETRPGFGANAWETYKKYYDGGQGFGGYRNP